MGVGEWGRVNTLDLVSVPMMETVRDKVNKLYGRGIQDGYQKLENTP